MIVYHSKETQEAEEKGWPMGIGLGRGGRGRGGGGGGGGYGVYAFNIPYLWMNIPSDLQ